VRRSRTSDSKPAPSPPSASHVRPSRKKKRKSAGKPLSSRGAEPRGSKNPDTVWMESSGRMGALAAQGLQLLSGPVGPVGLLGDALDERQVGFVLGNGPLVVDGFIGLRQVIEGNGVVRPQGDRFFEEGEGVLFVSQFGVHRPEII